MTDRLALQKRLAKSESRVCTYFVLMSNICIATFCMYVHTHTHTFAHTHCSTSSPSSQYRELQASLTRQASDWVAGKHREQKVVKDQMWRKVGVCSPLYNIQYCSLSNYLEEYTKCILFIRGTYYQYWLTVYMS